jgi:hypothetical protein
MALWNSSLLENGCDGKDLKNQTSSPPKTSGVFSSSPPKTSEIFQNASLETNEKGPQNLSNGLTTSSPLETSGDLESSPPETSEVFSSSPLKTSENNVRYAINESLVEKIRGLLEKPKIVIFHTRFECSFASLPLL